MGSSQYCLLPGSRTSSTSIPDSPGCASPFSCSSLLSRSMVPNCCSTRTCTSRHKWDPRGSGRDFEGCQKSTPVTFLDLPLPPGFQVDPDELRVKHVSNISRFKADYNVSEGKNWKYQAKLKEQGDKVLNQDKMSKPSRGLGGNPREKDKR